MDQIGQTRRGQIAKARLIISVILFLLGFLVLCYCPGWYAIASGFAGIAAETAKARDSLIQADRTERGAARDIVVADVVDLERAGIAAAQKHVGGVGAVEATEPRQGEGQLSSCHPRLQTPGG